MASYAAKIIELVAEVEAMEKRPDAVDDNETEEVKVKIKQVEALIKELKLSINSSTSVYQSLHVQVSLVDGNYHIRCNMDTIHWKRKKCVCFQLTTAGSTLDGLERTYDKNAVLKARREYTKVQLQLEECERRHQEIFHPNIGECTQPKPAQPLLSLPLSTWR